MKGKILILIALVFSCKTSMRENKTSMREKGRPCHEVYPLPSDGGGPSSYHIVLKNASEYNITIHYYSQAEKNPTPLGVDLYPINIPTGHQKIVKSYSGPKDMRFTYCWLTSITIYLDFGDPRSVFPMDSVRIYFNEGNSDERHITYDKASFKPRDLRSAEEYVVVESPVLSPSGTSKSPTCGTFYYTFTNEDYEEAIENQNATPTPIDIECD